jgi:hypothetical protein
MRAKVGRLGQLSKDTDRRIAKEGARTLVGVTYSNKREKHPKMIQNLQSPDR